jgi:uncharacterized membrane protein
MDWRRSETSSKPKNPSNKELNMSKLATSNDRIRQIMIGTGTVIAVILVANLMPTTGKPSVPIWALSTHVGSAVISLILGAWVLYNPKGTPRHKLAGKIWVVMMLAAAFSAFFIQSWGRLSPIHIFSVWTPISLGLGIYHIRKGNVMSHQKYMKGAYIGLVVAGTLAFALPGRFLWRLVFGG